MRAALAVTLGFFVSFPASSFGDFSVSFNEKQSAKTEIQSATFQHPVCWEEQDDSGKHFLRIIGGIAEKPSRERIDLVIKEVPISEGAEELAISIDDPKSNGTACFSTFDPKRKSPRTPHETFCTPESKPRGSCSGKLRYVNGNLTLSLKCEGLPRAINRDSKETLDFEISQSNPIQCKTRKSYTSGDRA